MQEPDSHVVPEPHLWSCFDGDASEDEVIEVIAALVRAEKPKVAVEVGSHVGICSAAIGEALRRNGRGRLFSFEIDPTRADQARKRTNGLPVVTIPMSDLIHAKYAFGEIDFLFVDGNLDNRLRSLRHWEPALRSNALVVVHDTLKYPIIQNQVANWISGWAEAAFSKIDIITPRGLTLMRYGG